MQEIVEQRILQGNYQPGTPLPSVRELAGEFGCSPSTIGRAIRELERSAWLQVINRRGTMVAHRHPRGTAADADREDSLRRLAHRWRLSGLNRAEFRRLADKIEKDVFTMDRRVLFLECNAPDLATMTQQVQATTTARVQPMLIDQARTNPGLLNEAVIFTPFFHLADVSPLVSSASDLVPLNFGPAPGVLADLASLSDGTKVAVIGADERSRRRIKAIVEQFSDARVRSTSIDDPKAARRLVSWADAVVTTHAAGIPDELRERTRRLITVTFLLDAASIPAVVAATGSEVTPAAVPG